MAKSVVRGKALVAKFRADPSVRDPEALAAYAGRKKALRKATKGKLKHRLKGGGKKKASKPSTPKAPNKMSDTELDSAIKFAAMAVDRGLPTPEERKRIAERYHKLLEEKRKRTNRRGLGYKY